MDEDENDAATSTLTTTTTLLTTTTTSTKFLASAHHLGHLPRESVIMDAGTRNMKRGWSYETQ